MASSMTPMQFISILGLSLGCQPLLRREECWMPGSPVLFILNKTSMDCPWWWWRMWRTAGCWSTRVPGPIFLLGTVWWGTSGTCSMSMLLPHLWTLQVNVKLTSVSSKYIGYSQVKVCMQEETSPVNRSCVCSVAQERDISAMMTGTGVTIVSSLMRAAALTSLITTSLSNIIVLH